MAAKMKPVKDDQPAAVVKEARHFILYYLSVLILLN